MNRYRKEIIACLLLIALTVAVFIQVRNHEFTVYDDPEYVTENPEVQAGWTWKGFTRAFTVTLQGHWHPLTLLSHMTDCQLFGLNPAGHHLSSLFLHLANTLLLFFTLKKMTGAVLRSGFVAALFALHPLHVEPVVWVADRKDLLAAFFWFLGMASYVYYNKHLSVSRYLLALFTFALGLMAKSMVVTLPCILFLLDYWPLRRLALSKDNQFQGVDAHPSPSPRGNRKVIAGLILEKIPFIILSGSFAMITAFLMKASLTTRTGGPKVLISLESVSKALVFYATYLVKMVWPTHMALPYPVGVMPPAWQIVGAAALILVVSLFVFWKGRRYPYLPVGWLWYLLTLAPVIGLVKFGPHRLADRYTYIPLVGLFFIIVWGLTDLVGKRRAARASLGTAAGFVIILLTGSSWVQVGYWKNDTSLFRHALDVTVNNHEAHNLFGVTLERQGKLQEAIRHLTLAVSAEPDTARYQHNLGIALGKSGELFDSALHLSRAVELQPSDRVSQYNLGVALGRLGKPERAIAQFKEALRIKPDYAQAHAALGNTLARMGKLDEAIAEFKEALRIKPDLNKVRRSLRHALEQRRRSRRE